ncbi:DNA polymerase/3'-5' exonuclease PolX [Candidatus Amarolinea aalborgensis]|uniref:DNA polymerase/3'-5' exonuclease PolX n=1 Tax=Candidatus Amarolinea aalborgensis TaxID=2249329 RepID=UPI003BFA2897
MTNHELANTFRLIADLLDIQGEVIYVTLAYRKVADNLDALGRDINDVWREGKLREIPGVGKAIADKMDELLRTGQLGFLERLQAEVPATLAELLRVPDLGPKKINLFWRSLGVTTLAQLEAAARGGQLRSLSGMGAKSEAKILAGLESLGRRSGRTPLGAALPAALEMLAALRQAPGVVDAALGGSLRRMKSTVGDLDLLAAAADSAPVMQAFVSQPGVARILGQGGTKASVEFVNGLRAQLWVHPPERFGTALQYATGSKEHNVRLRQLALDRGLSLSDQALVRADGSEILCATEAEVYAVLGLPWIAPELREDRGEIQAALAGSLPALIESSQRRAELHSHSTWSDGRATIREMALAARARGLQVLAITDHSGGLGITGGLSLEDIVRQRAEIEALQIELGDSIRLLQGAEVEIRADGTLDYSDEVLAQFDIIVASLHTSLRQPRTQVTNRLLNAIRNPHVDIIGHPTGRLIPDREGADLDMDAVLAAAAASGVALEINANPNRLDLDDVYARRAMEMGIRLAINTDAHDPGHLAQEVFGIALARRAWVEPQHVINTWQPDALLAWLGARS